MKPLPFILFVASLFIAGFSVGSGRGLIALITAIAGVIIIYPVVRQQIGSRRIVKQSSVDGTAQDGTPDFVREELENGDAETSTKALTPEYKRAVRETIEVQILETLGTLLELIRSTIPCHTAAFFRRNHTGALQLFLYDSDCEDVVLGALIKPGEGLVGQMLKEKGGKAVLEGDIRTSSNTLMFYSVDKSIKSIAGAPLTIEESCRGVLVVDSKEKNAFDDIAMEKLERFAHMAAAFQYYAYLQLENHIDRDKVTALSVLQRAFFKCETANDVVLLLGDILERVTQADRITVSLIEEGTKDRAMVRFAKGIDEESFKDYAFAFPENGLVGLVYVKKDVVQRSFEPGKYVPRFNAKEKHSDVLLSILAVPIYSGSDESCIGVITLESAALHRFSKIDVEGVINLSNATGLALEKVKMLAAQTHLATMDGLTMLPNHREFQNAIERSLKRVRRQSGELGLILCDIDHFKKINDTYGHPAGDAILKGVADVLRNSIRRDVDFVARYGGEEFACVVESGEDRATETAERMRSAVEKTPYIIAGGQKIQVTMSFGLAMFPKDAQDKKTLVERADKALYSAKKSGRNQVKKL
jgi:diguanylate cyclase (GGDEF)-like protein